MSVRNTVISGFKIDIYNQWLQNFPKNILRHLNLGAVLVWHRSSRPEMFCKKGVLRNFAKFTGKHLCQSLFSNKVAGPRPAILLKRRLLHWCFPVNFTEFLRTPFYIEHLWWLLVFDSNFMSIAKGKIYFSLI